ncbi:MAG: DNA adenine methylase [Spirochaetales bacterium]|nr:DNA adenine methylase [Spirochaetales bacterium]
MSSLETISPLQKNPSNNSDHYKDYPLLRYMGSKYKLLDWIKDELSAYEFDSVLDGFSGSGAVSYLFKSMGKTVFSNDFLHMSYTFAKATCENNDQILDNEDLEILLDMELEAPDFIQKTFKDIFYTEDELLFLDKVSNNIKRLDNPYKESLAKAAIIRSCLKKQPRGVFTISGNMDKYNDGRRDLRLSLQEHFREQIEIYNSIIFSNNKNNIAFNGDIYQFNEEFYSPDLVYLDPPYVPRSDDNCYVKRYHFIEGLSKYWENEEIDYSTKVHKIKKKYTPFSYRRTAIEAFDTMFEKFRKSIIVLSYSSNGYPDLETLVDILGKYKTNIEIKRKDHKYHFGNHKKVSRSKVEEYLIIGS